MDDVARYERRVEERKPLDVVPVHVAEEEMRRERHLLQHALAEETESRAPIEDEHGLPRAHLDAARVASDTDRIWSRGRDAPADTPKGDAHLPPFRSPWDTVTGRQGQGLATSHVIC